MYVVHLSTTVRLNLRIKLKPENVGISKNGTSFYQKQQMTDLSNLLLCILLGLVSLCSLVDTRSFHPDNSASSSS